MAEATPLRRAGRGFSRHVRALSAGQKFAITPRGGADVASVPAGLTPIQAAALSRTRLRMARGWPIGAGPLDRAALHER